MQNFIKGISVACRQLEAFPSISQSSCGRGRGNENAVDKIDRENYAKLLSDYENGEDFLIPFFSMQAYGNEDMFYLPLAYGEYYDLTVNYSDYIDTGEPFPVVVGYDLRDLFTVGEVYDAVIPYAIPSEELDFYEDGRTNAKIKVTGVLSEDAFGMVTGAGSVTTQRINTTIIMPKFNFWGWPYESKTDSTVFERGYGEVLKTCTVLSTASGKESIDKYAQVVESFGLEGVFDKPILNCAYQIKGISTDTYKAIIFTILASVLIMLVLSLLAGVINTVNKSVREYSIHYLVGAETSVFLRQVIVLPIIADIIACVSACALFELFGKKLLSNLGLLSIPTSYVIAVAAFVLVGVAVFVFLVALIKINKTDFSRTLKEDA